MVQSIKVVKLYYVSTGRNAWWNTWITRYSPGCMHTTLESAIQFCEGRRVQGTVFYIDELPSLAFMAEGRALVVSEINTDNFFKRLNTGFLNQLTSVFPVSTMSLDQFVYMFRPSSPLWPTGYPQNDSAILSYHFLPGPLEEMNSTDALVSRASHSNGPNYRMWWSDRPFEKDRSTLHSVAAGLQGRLAGT